MHRLRRTSVIAILATLIVTLPSAGNPTVTTESVVRSGAYGFAWFGKSLGNESFTISRTPDGYRIDATLRLEVDGQKPCASSYFLDAERRLVRATYRELTPGGAEAEYEITNDTLIARGTGGAAEGIERRYELEPGTVVTGPHYVTDFFVLDPLDLEVGKRHTQAAYAFGFGGWEPSRVTLESKREHDRKITVDGRQKVKTNVYKCTIRTPKKTFRTRSWLDADGVSARITVGAPIGSMDVRLKNDG